MWCTVFMTLCTVLGLMLIIFHSLPQMDSRMHVVHMFVTICTVLGLMFALTAVVQYYDVVCCGEMKLWQWWMQCLCKVKNVRTRRELVPPYKGLNTQ